MDRGAWWPTVHEVANSRIQLRDETQHSFIYREKVPDFLILDELALYFLPTINSLLASHPM